MKLIRFGSFPLVQIKKEEHKCLDNYLLKHFSDSISFSNAITNLSIMQNTFYITPEKIIASMQKKSGSYTNTLKRRNANQTADDLGIFDKNKTERNYDYNNYEESNKRAFKILSKFYVQISEAPFYKGMVYYPIYVEKYMRDATQGGKISAQYNFNFILLTNNLINDNLFNNNIDEAAVINVLYIFIHLFKSDILFNDVSRNTTPASFSNFNSKQLVQVMQFYKLIQKFDLNPVTVFLAIYDLISFSKTEFNNKIDNMKNFADRLKSRAVNRFNPDDTKFRGLVKIICDRIIIELTRLEKNGEGFQSTEIILNIVKIMLEHNEINDFIENINDTKYSRDHRMELVADYNHYQSIIKIFEELVKFNELTLKDIIQDHDINFSKDIVLSGNTENINLTTFRGAIDRPLFDQSYSNWQTDCVSFILKTVKTVITRQLTKEINIFYDYKSDPEYKSIVNDLNTLWDDIKQIDEDIKLTIVQINNLTGGNPNAVLTPQLIIARKKYSDLVQQKANLKAEQLKARAEVNKIKADLGALAQTHITTIMNGFENKLDTLVNAFGNIYEDLSNIFLNPLMIQLFFTNNDIKKLFNLNENNFNLDCLDLQPTLINFKVIQAKLKAGSAIESQSIEVLTSLIQQLTIDINYLMDMYLNIISGSINNAFNDTNNSFNDPSENILKAKLSKIEYDKLTANFISDCYKKLCNFVFKPMLLKLSRVQIHEQNQLQYSHELNDLHPILGKMARNINNFKSFIFGITTLETLYDLIVLTKEKLFYNGLLKKPLHKLNTSEAKIRYILNTVLELDQNPVWIVGSGKVRLHMPDYLSLTGVSFTTDVKQGQLRSICKLDPKKWWSENNIGNNYDYTKRNVDLSRETDALRKAQDEQKKNPSVANSAKVKRAREILEKKRKDSENKIDNSLGNIGLNITKTADDKFYGPGGLGDSIKQIAKQTISADEYLEKINELKNNGLDDDEIQKKLDREYAVIDNPINTSMQQMPMQQMPMQQMPMQQMPMQQMPMQQMPNDPRNYINDYSKRTLR